MKNWIRFLDLQLFGAAEEEEQQNTDAAFDALIAGEYKEAYERKVQALQAQLEEEKLGRAAGELQKQYPDFSLEQERKDPHFCALLAGGMELRSAYELCHREELLASLREQSAAAARPRENGMGGQSAAAITGDVAGLSRAQRREIIRRVQRGETIRF